MWAESSRDGQQSAAPSAMAWNCSDLGPCSSSCHLACARQQLGRNDDDYARAGALHCDRCGAVGSRSWMHAGRSVSYWNICLPVSVRPKEARTWLPGTPLLHLVSYGSCVVAQTAPSINGAISRLLDNMFPAWMCFQPEFTARYARILEEHGFDAQLYLDSCFLPAVIDGGQSRRKDDVQMRTLEKPALAPQHIPAWKNALSDARPELDVLGVGAYDWTGRLLR